MWAGKVWWADGWGGNTWPLTHLVGRWAAHHPPPRRWGMSNTSCTSQGGSASGGRGSRVTLELSRRSSLQNHVYQRWRRRTSLIPQPYTNAGARGRALYQRWHKRTRLIPALAQEDDAYTSAGTRGRGLYQPHTSAGTGGPGLYLSLIPALVQ